MPGAQHPPPQKKAKLELWFLSFFFVPRLQHAEVLGPEIEPVLQLQPNPQIHSSSNAGSLTCHQGTLALWFL